MQPGGRHAASMNPTAASPASVARHASTRLIRLGSLLSALGSLSYAANNAAQHCQTHRLTLRQTMGRTEPSEPFSETPAHRGPDHDATSVERCAVVRNRFFLRGGSVFLRQVPARNVTHSLGFPLKSHRALAPPPAAAETLPAVAPALGLAHASRCRSGADLSGGPQSGPVSPRDAVSDSD